MTLNPNIKFINRLLDFLESDDDYFFYKSYDFFLMNISNELIAKILSLLNQRKRATTLVKFIADLNAEYLKSLIDMWLLKPNTKSLYPICRGISRNPSTDTSKIILYLADKLEEDFLAQIMLMRCIAYRSFNIELAEDTKQYVTQQLMLAGYTLSFLKNYSTSEESLQLEVQSRCLLLKAKILYQFAALLKSETILNIIPNLISSQSLTKSELANYVELIDSLLQSKQQRDLLKLIIDEDVLKAKQEQTAIDATLSKILSDFEDNAMLPQDKIITLRKVKLFKSLPFENLLAISEIIQEIDLNDGDVIFEKGDEGDGFYIIESGKVSIVIDGNEVAELPEYAFFGELGLFATGERKASALSKGNTKIYFIAKQDFNRIADDNPKILRTIVDQVVTYIG